MHSEMGICVVTNICRLFYMVKRLGNWSSKKPVSLERTLAVALVFCHLYDIQLFQSII